jgi:hypothetical protein
VHILRHAAGMSLPADLARQPFRRSDALRAGPTVRELAGPGYRRVFHDVYVAAGVRLTALERARAACLVFPDAYASHHTAAAIWGGVPPDDWRTHISAPAGSVRSRRRGIAAHRAVTDADLRTYRGLRVAAPSQCFCELAAGGADLVSLVVLGDSLVKVGAATPEVLIAAADAWGRARAAVAGRAARLVREGVDSPQESRLRMLIVLAGLPEPQVNFVLRHENGDWKRRSELSYPELKLLIEYDGDHHLVSEHQWAVDLTRREELEHLGWRLLVIQKNHLHQHPEDVLQRIVTARLDRGAPRRECRIRPTWRNYFHAA